MCYACQYFRSLLFVILMYGWMAVLGLIGAIPALLKREWAYKIMEFYCASVFWLARNIVNLDFEVRGEVPDGHIIVASKHQSFYDILIHFHVLSRGSFVMKKELKWAPVLGWYAMRIGTTAVNRGGKGKAVSDMVNSAKNNPDTVNQLVIYPQGTRVSPGDHKPYKVGAAVLMERMDRPCAIAATNVGMFWPRKGIIRYPGVAVIEYLGWMPSGLTVEEATRHLEAMIEPASDRLMDEAAEALSKL